jgi:spermidine synthase
MRPRAAIGLAFLSGFVALGYEILWARRLSDLIGATALASSLVVGVFFVMLAAGAIALGPLATRTRSPWRLYAKLELGILLAIVPAVLR